MRILITGGAGFIGSHLCERFLSQGHSVLCLDNFLTGHRGNVKHLGSDPNFQLVEHNIAQPYEPPVSLDAVLHFASPASPVDYLKYPIQTLKVGSLGTLNALGIAKAKGAKFLLASTSEVYGDPQVHPQSEEYWGHVNPVGPRGVYDEAKRFSEAMTMAYHRTHGIDTRIARIFNSFGPRMRREDGRAIPNFITQALTGQPITLYGDGSQTRSFCFISDTVDGLEKLLLSKVVKPVNIGNPVEKSLSSLAKTILQLTQSSSPITSVPLPEDDPKVRCPNLDLARETLGWAPQVSLEEGLKQTIAWFRQALKVGFPD